MSTTIAMKTTEETDGGRVSFSWPGLLVEISFREQSSQDER